MRITFVLAEDNLSGGVRIIAQYASRLKRRGHEVQVVTRPPRRRSLRENLRGLLRDGRWGKEAPKESHFQGTGIDLKVLESHRPIGEADLPDADVVIATYWTTAPWVNALSPRKGAKVLFIQHYEEVTGRSNDGLDASWRMPMRKIVVAPWLSELAASRFGDPGAIVVTNGVDVTQFQAEPRGKQRVPRVGLLYHTAHSKGVDISLAAVERARREISDLRLISFGAKKPTRGLPLPKGTEFLYTPLQSQIKDVYASCDAWLFGSRSEGFGLPILEAMACRTPVIGVRIGVAPDLLKNGGGRVVAPEDPEDMARAIVDLCRLPEDRWKAMSEAAWSTARSYTVDDAVLLFEKALQTAVREPALPAAPRESNVGARAVQEVAK